MLRKGELWGGEFCECLIVDLRRFDEVCGGKWMFEFGWGKRRDILLILGRGVDN